MKNTQDVLSQPIHQRWGSVSPLKERVIGQDKTASSCTWGDLDWISRKISSLKARPGIGTACPGKQWNHHPGSVQEMPRCGSEEQGLVMGLAALG